MSTILKALRRLEEERPTRRADAGSRTDALPATDPRAANELRDRILAEESAAEIGETAEHDSDRTKRNVWIAGATVLVLGLGLGAFMLSTRVEPDPAEAFVAATTLAEPPTFPTADSMRPAGRREQISERRPSPISAIPVVPESIVESPPATLALVPPNVVAVAIAPPGRPVASVSTPIEPPSQAAPAKLVPPQAPPSPAPVATASPEMALAAVTPTPATLARSSRPKAVVPAATPTPAPVVPIAKATPPRVHPKPTKTAVAPPSVSAPKPKPVAPPKTAESEPKREIQSNPSPKPVEQLDQPGLPDLVVVRTAWHPKAERRSVRIRLEATDEILTLREGDAVGGLVIQVISPSAVVFKAGEVEIRRRVGQPGSGG